MDDVTTILVVDDEPDIRESLCAHLEKSGFVACGVDRASSARERLAKGDVSLVVLDIMMPGEDGLSLCRHLRESAGPPVILLTALADDTDRIVGLEVGADDYVSKPFNPRELVARIRAVLRRTHAGQPGETPGDRHSDKAAREAEGQILTHFAGWSLNEAQAELTRSDGVIVPLSSGELALLKVFLAHPDEVLSRDDLMNSSRGREIHPFERSIDNMIARLRRKLERDPKKPRIIKTVWGGGYRLVTDAAGP